MKRSLKILINVSMLVVVFAIITSCKKTYDSPPVQEIPESSRINVSQIKALLTGTISSYKFASDINLYCTVLNDEISGNFYKEAFVRDATGALRLVLVSSGGLYIGDSIRVNLKGSTLTKNSGNFEVDSVNVDQMVVKQKTGLSPQPIQTTLANLLLNTASTSSLVGQLVTITNCEFVAADQNQPWAFASTQSSANRTLTACPSGSTVLVYTSGFANFANQYVPAGNGNLTGIMTLYSNKPEMKIRNYAEVNMTGALCGTTSTTSTSYTYTSKDFNDNSLLSGGWDTIMPIGNLKWTTASFSGSTYAKVSGYSSGNKNTEMWLISPSMNLSAATNPNVYFTTAAASFAGNPLQVFVSTNYVSGAAPSTATWTQLTAAMSPTTTSYVWTPSGTVSLSAYKTPNTFIAFKYTSTTSAAATYELDDVIVKEN